MTVCMSCVSVCRLEEQGKGKREEAAADWAMLWHVVGLGRLEAFSKRSSACLVRTIFSGPGKLNPHAAEVSKAEFPTYYRDKVEVRLNMI